MTFGLYCPAFQQTPWTTEAESNSSRSEIRLWISVSTVAQYSVSQTTQITGSVWHWHTPSSGYTYTHVHLKLTSPRLHNRCFLCSLRATWNQKPTGVCLGKWRELQQSSRFNFQSTKEGKKSGRGGWTGRAEVGLYSSMSAVALCVLRALEHRGQTQGIPNGNMHYFLLFYCLRVKLMEV